MEEPRNRLPGTNVRLAYLCNLYPAVSHSFVRREIEGVEQAGHEVHRFSIRPARSDLKDEADLKEARLTEAVLGQGRSTLFAGAIAMMVARPLKSVSAFVTAYRLSSPGIASKIKHAAYWVEAAWLARRLTRLGVEHLHAHFGTNPAAVALLVREFGGPRFSFTAHGPDEFDAPIALSLGQKIAAASFVAAISSYGRAQLMRWSAPKDWEKIGIIRCGIDSAFLDAPATPPTAETTRFVCVARLSAQKGIPLLIAACERLRGNGERFTLTIIGDGEMRAEIEEDIRRRELEEIVSLAGVQTAAEIREQLLGARAFVLPSFAEGLPVVLMEALALSRPVIATAIAGVPELVDEKCGWLIPAGSEKALVEAMIEALRSPPSELAAKGAAGRERALRLHDVSRNAAALVGHFGART
jgi:colanic acid/amylovoran biosynthesis glycosyltransferase